MSPNAIAVPLFIILLVSGCSLVRNNPLDENSHLGVSSLKVSPNTLVMVEGDTRSLSVAILPKLSLQTVHWSMNRSEIVTGNLPELTALSEGQVTIRATSRKDQRLVDYCDVRVLKKPVPHFGQPLGPIDTLTPTFAWGHRHHPTGHYTLQVSGSSTFDSLILHQENIAMFGQTDIEGGKITHGGYASYTITSPLKSQSTYFWRILIFDADQHLLLTSSAAMFTTP